MTMWRVFVAPLFLMPLASCERIVSIETRAGDRRLVVEARVERVRNTLSSLQTIRLSLTSPYFEPATSPPATGAIVTVTSHGPLPQGDVVISFPESPTQPGTYQSNPLDNLRGVVGRLYTLSIDYEGERYESTERLLPVARIDSIYLAESTIGFGEDGPRATIDFTDRADEDNWYMWEQYVNGVRLLGADSGLHAPVVASDEAVNGRELVRFQPYSQIVAPGDQIVVRQMSLSESLYRYFTALGEQTSNDGSPFAVPPSNVRGNVSNRTNPAHYPLGYFLPTEVFEAAVVRPES